MGFVRMAMGGLAALAISFSAGCMAGVESGDTAEDPSEAAEPLVTRDLRQPAGSTQTPHVDEDDFIERQPPHLGPPHAVKDGDPRVAPEESGAAAGSDDDGDFELHPPRVGPPRGSDRGR